MLKFILEAGPFSDDIVLTVAQAWGWKESSGISAQAFVLDAGKKRFVDILAAPKIAQVATQLQQGMNQQVQAAKTQVSAEVASMVSFSVAPVTEQPTE